MRKLRTRISAVAAAVAAVTATGLTIGTPMASAQHTGSQADDHPDFSPSSTSWTSDLRGWAFGWSGCDAGTCATLLRTADGGDTWTDSTPPPLQPSDNGTPARILFTGRGHDLVGLATDGRTLYVTRDHARSWRQVRLPGAGFVGDVDATRRHLYVAGVSRHGDRVTTRLYRSPVARDHFTRVQGVHRSGTGTPASTLTDISTTRRAVDVAFSSWNAFVSVWTSPDGRTFTKTSPCGKLAATRLGAGSRQLTYVLCSYNPGRGHMYKRLKSSTGGDFDTIGMAPTAGITSDFAAAGPSTVAIGATGGDAAFVHLSTDGGRTWRTTLAAPDTGPVLDLRFTDAEHGTLVAGYPDLGTSVVYRSTDGGLHWSPVSF